MVSSKTFEDFKPIEVPLAGSNLIQASAGTGKTYSIAILMLRLLLEKEMLVKEVLMVTFTKAAVAELEERIRLFIRSAYKYVQGGELNDATIAEVVDHAIEKSGEEKVERLLREAVLFLDETAVLTIHSFCQQTLTQFAFETRQLFGVEILLNTGNVLGDEVNKFWRKEVTTLPSALLEILISSGFSRDSIKSILNDHLGGKHYLFYKHGEVYSYCTEDHNSILQTLSEIKSKEDEMRSCLIQQVLDSTDDLQALIQSNGYARKSLSALLAKPKVFLDMLFEKKCTGYVQKLFPHLLEPLIKCDDCVKDRDKEIEKVISRYHCMAIQQIEQGIKAFKLRNNQVSFDDMIVNLHEALVIRKESNLIEGLKEKYKAVFIDEFQDTDRLQYEIFQSAFKDDAILFYIGDPKQSIYAWRKADIDTYFSAFHQVDHLYGMNKNYRSSTVYIEAMNLFFQPEEDFDTFHFEASEDRIDYINVESPSHNTKGTLLRDNQSDVPISIVEAPNQTIIENAVIAQVIALLDGKTFLIDKNDKKRPVSPSDIGILVRNNSLGRTIKNLLSKCNIPAVTIGESKVLHSEQAVELLYILEAINNISMSSINRALLSPLTGYTIEDILHLKEEEVMERFTSYKARWTKDGIYAAMIDFMADFNVQQVLLGRHTENGERIITNLFQLIELFHKEQSTKMLSELELLSWLRRGIDKMETEGNEYEQRVESDEEAVKIVTIHTSKGLQYNIVLAPKLDLVFDEKKGNSSIKNKETGNYISGKFNEFDVEQQDLIRQQAEQENRRLLYVTITRAVYKCYIYKNTFFKRSTLVPFVSAVKNLDESLILFEDPLVLQEGYQYNTNQPAIKVPDSSPVHFELTQQNWMRMSYSRLNVQHDRTMRFSYQVHKDKYDLFVFNELPKGANTGNMLHHLFETINFMDPEKWMGKIESSLKRFAPRQESMFADRLLNMVEHVMQTEIVIDGTSITLSGVAYNNRIHELEFDFTVPLFNPYSLKYLSTEEIRIDVNGPASMEGVMNGKIDLFFEWKGKYYVLDWKSNFLGDKLEDYTQENMAQAMNENNYHLQYFLYTLAVKKYLQSRLPDFEYERDFGGVIYMFLRGIRKGSSNGVYVQKPSEKTIINLENVLTAVVQEL
ncbi:Exodeoxyribonuclease V beta chain [Arcticibacter svalbardensis MN12-7]|uniref:RecBCD enzyme subunit RecB n=1 Tax=Arcticibacter svalbardensis MN12-7 TaxID=1150600 RepID=R9GVW7_9SPHI|nr:exodeoxyribonuclease V subunit beta [Arcticibacter svalbardensis]EOR95813.1 Exodeoxyribonuclease V beta chain [Arcticibacter svalbardensis MN12-7]